MSQNDLVIANQNFPATRADINNALQALGSNNSGATEPATTYASMLWHDTTAEVLKIRSEANDAWIIIGYLDQAAGAFRILDDTQLVNTSGTQVGLLGDQATATWEGGTGTLQSLVSPANVKAVVDANVTNPVKAWVNFNGVGGITIRGSFNVSSVGKSSTGLYTINYAVSMANVNYAVSLASENTGALLARPSIAIGGVGTSSLSVTNYSHTNSLMDSTSFHVTITQ